MRRQSPIGVLAATLALLALPLTASAAGFQNGSFESGSWTGGSYNVLATGSTAITGWTVGLRGVDWVDASHGWQMPAGGGNRVIDLNDGGGGGQLGGSIYQTFDTVVGHTYLVTFQFAANPETGSPNCDPFPLKTMDVQATPGGSVAQFQRDTTTYSTANMGWTEKQYWFAASAAATMLTFASTNYGNCGVTIDLVAVTEVAAVPATKAACKKGGWQSLTDEVGRPFKNQGDCVSYVETDGANPAAG